MATRRKKRGRHIPINILKRRWERLAEIIHHRTGSRVVGTIYKAKRRHR